MKARYVVKCTIYTPSGDPRNRQILFLERDGAFRQADILRMLGVAGVAVWKRSVKVDADLIGQCEICADPIREGSSFMRDKDEPSILFCGACTRQESAL